MYAERRAMLRTFIKCFLDFIYIFTWQFH